MRNVLSRISPIPIGFIDEDNGIAIEQVMMMMRKRRREGEEGKKTAADKRQQDEWFVRTDVH